MLQYPPHDELPLKHGVSLLSHAVGNFPAAVNIQAQDMPSIAKDA